jgi:phosphoglycerol transferase MdoB-like AlkP superfamily enzyme
MINFKNTFSNKLIFNLKATFLLLHLFSLILTFLMLWIQPTKIADILVAILNGNYLMLLLNFLPILFFTLLTFFLTNNVVITASFVSIVIISVSFINRFKILLRDDPFRPLDVFLGTEAITVTSGFNFKSLSLSSLLFLLIITSITVLSMLIKNKKLNFKIRVLLFIISSMIVLLSNKFIFSNYKLNHKLPVFGNQYSQVQISNSKGFLYNFIYTFNTNRISKPDNYNKSEIEKIISAETYEKNNTVNSIPEKKPHIIMIMSEAYSNIGLNSKIDFTGYTDPMKFYKELTGNSITGNIVVANVGGGTADTEFDVLTGFNTRQFRGVAYSYMLVSKPFKSINTILNNLGYSNLAMHPGFSWFYNRANVFRYFQFQNFIDIKSFDEDRYKGMYVDEESTFDTIIQNFNHHIASESTPFFSLNINIQNHGPYLDKYLSKTNFATSLDLSEDDINTLSNYFEGVADQDRELKRLIEYLQKLEEPVVVVYFGDHLPALSQDSYYKLIPNADSSETSFEGMTRMFETPFLIWQNEPAKNIISFDGYELENNVFSSFYLGALLLDLLGYSEIDPYFKFLNELRVDYPVILENFYFDKEKQLHDISSNNTDINKFMNWSYYTIFDE